MKAFPSNHDPKTGTMQLGMDLKDWYFGLAIQGMLSNPALFDTNGEFQEDNIKVAYEIAELAMKVRSA